MRQTSRIADGARGQGGDLGRGKAQFQKSWDAWKTWAQLKEIE